MSSCRDSVTFLENNSWPSWRPLAHACRTHVLFKKEAAIVKSPNTHRSRRLGCQPRPLGSPPQGKAAGDRPRWHPCSLSTRLSCLGTRWLRVLFHLGRSAVRRAGREVTVKGFCCQLNHPRFSRQDRGALLLLTTGELTYQVRYLQGCTLTTHPARAKNRTTAMPTLAPVLWRAIAAAVREKRVLQNLNNNFRFQISSAFSSVPRWHSLRSALVYKVIISLFIPPDGSR
jgi:hypothetical protein